jgi:hypothetical protein
VTVYQTATRTYLYRVWLLSAFLLPLWTLCAFPPFSPVRDALGLFVLLVEYVAVGLLGLCALFAAVTNMFFIKRSLPMSVSSTLVIALCLGSISYIKAFGNINIFAEGRALRDSINGKSDSSCDSALSNDNLCVIYAIAYGDGDYLIARVRSSTARDSLEYKWPPFPNERVELRQIGESYMIVRHDFPYAGTAPLVTSEY